MNSLNIVKIKNDNAELNILPDFGGKISSFSFNDFNVFRPLPIDNLELLENYKGGCFSLIPFSNRIKNAKFYFDNSLYKIKNNENTLPHSIHGHGYLGKWELIKKTPSTVIISYLHHANTLGWPWEYKVHQTISLDDYTCSIEITITNNSRDLMPFGFGIHPFFNFDDEVKLRFEAEREWIGPPETFPTKTQIIKDDFNYTNGNDLWKIEKTVSYENFKGNININWVNKKKEITLKADKIFNHLIIHVPSGSEYFCAEPVSQPTDGFNLAYNKIENVKNRFLKPGESITGLIEITLNN